jgi:DNA (cytosine-5)-methyltransferase 1
MDWAFHPKPQTDPVAVESVCPEEKGKRYVSFRNAGGGALNSWLPSTKPLPTIMRGGGVQYYTERLAYDKPAPTIKKSLGSFGLGFIHPEHLRRITIAELKRLGSFPDEYRLTGKFEEQWARIGNSVPPLLMKAIAEHIRNAILMPLSRARIACGASVIAVQCLAKAGA